MREKLKLQVVSDTNIISYCNKGHDFYELYRDYLTDKKQLISFMTYMELYRGMYKAQWSEHRISSTEILLTSYTIIYPDETMCKICAKILNVRRHQPISIQDAWVAATAIYLDCTLVTHNAPDFIDIPGLDLYTQYKPQR